VYTANIVEHVALIVNMMVQSYAVANFWKKDKLDRKMVNWRSVCTLCFFLQFN
jgi:hypothetical protein